MPRSLSPRFDDLLALGCSLSTGHEEEAVRSLALDLLAPIGDERPRGGRSELNGDGTPLQLCLSSSARGIVVRFVTDPAWELGDGAQRLTASIHALDNALAGAQAMALRPLAMTTLDSFVPGDEDLSKQGGRGFLWLAAGPSTPGTAVYFDAAPLADSAWDRAQSWLDSILPHAHRPSLAALRSCARLASVGLEGTSPEDARAKLYFRLTQPTRLDSLGCELLSSPALAALLAAVVERRDMRLSGTVFGLGFSVAKGTLVDAKLDLCGHCVPRVAESWRETLTALAAAYGVAPYPAEVFDALAHDRAEVAFIGTAIDVAGRVRMNLYLKPREEKKEIRATTAPDVAIDRAIRYLSTIQRHDGSIEDYRLPVGRSTEWVTAFVALAAARATHDRAATLVRRAAAWLTESRSYSAGWGYNGVTGPDADSTGFALRLFTALGIENRAEDEAWLLEKWQRGGGFATYDGPLAWGHAHPCVTAAAFLALRDRHRDAHLEELFAYVARSRRSNGTWPSYWWRSHHYSTYHHLRLLQELDIRITPPTREDPDETASAFELAYALGIEHRARGASAHRDALASRLMALQRTDGSFPGAPNLRVTDPECARPWEAARGALYCDERSSLTTASALMILLEVFS